MTWTTAELLSDVRRKGRIPTSDPVYTAAAILREADEAVNEMFTPAILKINENYGTKTKLFSISADDNSYRIPSRAFGDLVQHAEFVDENGSARRLNHYHLSQLHTLNDQSGSMPDGLVIEGNEAILVPTPDSGVGQLRVKYQHRPGKFVETTAAMKITAIAGNVLSGNAPSGWTTNDIFDLVQDKPGFDTFDIDRAISAVTGGVSVTLSAAPPSDLVVGDWVALAWQTPVQQIPLELHSPLSRAVAGRIRMDLGDTQSGTLLLGQAEAGLRRVVSGLTPRVKGISRKVHNQQSFLRGRGARTRRWGNAT